MPIPAFNQDVRDAGLNLRGDSDRARGRLNEVGQLQHLSISSRGLGECVLNATTGVRIPVSTSLR